jgi:hypothetical protein
MPPKKNAHCHLLAKTESAWLGFQDFSTSHLCRLIVATHTLKPAFSHLNRIPPM